MKSSLRPKLKRHETCQRERTVKAQRQHSAFEGLREMELVGAYILGRRAQGWFWRNKWGIDYERPLNQVTYLNKWKLG